MTSVPTKAIEAQRASAAISAEFVMTDADFRRIAEMLHADAGIHVPNGKAALVYSRLAKRLRALGLESFRDYCELVSSHAGVSERQQMLAALTTNVTRFFREPHHFEHLRKQVLPALIEKARHGGRVRFWSAACSKRRRALFDCADNSLDAPRCRQLRHQGFGDRHRPQYGRRRNRRAHIVTR